MTQLTADDHSAWIDMQEGCYNCGKPLEARPAPTTGFIIRGYEPMEWRHTDGTVQCVIIRNPRPYSDANQRREYDRLKEEAENPSAHVAAGVTGHD